MKIGLLGKILLAFSLTLVALGLVLTVLLGTFSAEDRSSLRLARPFLLVLERTLEQEGQLAAERQRLLIKRSIRDRITIAPETGAGGLPLNESVTVRRAMAPNGKSFLLRFQPDLDRKLSDVPMFALWGILATGLLFSFALAAYLTWPLRLLRDGFERLAAGDLDVRLAPRLGRRNDEIADLAHDFDVMAARLSQLVTARDRLLNDVSHELRSPLTRLQLAIALAWQDPARTTASLKRIEQEADKLDLLVGELLTLALAESGADVGSGFFDPVGVITAVVADAELEAHAKGCGIEWTAPSMLERNRPLMAGSAGLFRRAIENVVRNAIRFSPEGASIEIAVEIMAAPPLYRIAVRDRGPGVTPELIEKLFDPFVRADQGGTGLGLAIAKRAIRAHHGTIACRNRENGGFAVEIEVPARLALG